ncbi:MAG: response regulator [Treponemataceae bacterium]|nr:response regulator [Treponemataceae bacterium]
MFQILIAENFGESKKDVLYISSEQTKSDGLQYSAIIKNISQDIRLHYQILNHANSDFFEKNFFSAIIAADDGASDFVEENREKFFNELPTVTLGTNSILNNANKMRYSHFIEDSTFLDENIKLCVSLFPAGKKIVFVIDSEKQKNLCTDRMKKYNFEYEFKNIVGVSKEELQHDFSTLEKCIILFLPSAKEYPKGSLNPDYVIDVICHSTQNPIFACHDIGFGEGVLGGYFFSLEDLAVKTTRAMNMIFAPQNFYDLYEATQIQANYYFDRKQMQKFHISKKSLNSKTKYINDTAENPKKRYALIFFLTSVFSLVSIILIIFFMRKKIRLQKDLLREERMKFNSLVEQSDVLFWECYFADKNYEEENDLEKKYTNIAQKWIDSDMVPQEYVIQYNKVIRDLRSGMETVSIDLPISQQDKRTHLTDTAWKHVVFRAIKNHNEKGIRAIATATDITSKKRKEEEYESEVSYRSFVNKEYPVYTRLNLTSNIVMERMVDIPELKMSVSDGNADKELELIAKTVTNNGQNPNIAEVLQRKELLILFMNGTRTQECDFYFVFPDEMIHWYKLTVDLSLNPYTSCIEANIYIREITDFKIKTISKDSVLDEEVEYIFWLDINKARCNFIHRANSANWIPEDLGGDYAELVDFLLNDLISTKDVAAAKEFFALKNLMIQLKDRLATTFAFEIMTDNLRISIKQIRAYYLKGNQNIILFICRDITDITLFEKLQNEKLSRAIEQTEKANASKSDFLSRMSHDLRTPMNGILGMARLAEDELDQPQAIKEDLRKIKSSSQYMLGLLNDILDMSKIESGKMEIRKSRNNVGEMLESVVTMAKSMCQNNGITFYCNMDASKYMNTFINVDRLHTQQVIMNLLSNASKFTPEGGRVEFLVNIIDRKDNIINVEFVISDNGSGMTKEFQQVMFESFTQDVNSINKVGTGLGLSIVHNLVQLMDGTIECESAPGEGTKFVIKMTVEYLEETSDEKKNSAQKSRKAVELAGKKILLVEDNPLNQEISRRLLQKKGMVVTMAENGLVALETFSQSEMNAFDLILMDVMMPVMGGIESATKIRALEREDAKNIPIIALTANAFTEDIEKCLEAGMNTHLSKPINPVLLMNTISEYLS